MKMQNSSGSQSSDEAPLYIRWSPDRSPYAIELKLDLVTKILRELTEAEKLGAEVGGVLVGSFPDAYMPTLRIEDIEVIPRVSEKDAGYLIDPGQQTQFSRVRWGVRARDTAALGLFRSHLRPGPLRPSPADRGFLSAQFKHAIYAALLVQGTAPHTAAFFLATDGQLPEDPAVREFRLNEEEFRALPEVQPDPVTAEPDSEAPRQPRIRLYGIIAALLLIGLGACFLMWSFTRQTALPPWLGSSHQLQLAITGKGHLLRISWNHAARQLDGSSGATLVITDGSARREIKLGLDELRLGAVEYDTSSRHVEVTMTPQTPGAASPSESAQWDQP